MAVSVVAIDWKALGDANLAKNAIRTLLHIVDAANFSDFFEARPKLMAQAVHDYYGVLQWDDAPWPE